MFSGCLTDIEGIRVGHASDEEHTSGCTAVLFDSPAVAGVSVMGGAPGTRETDLMRPGNAVAAVNGILLSGGSAFGLDTASGAMKWLAEQGRGFMAGEYCVPIVPAAVIFDLPVSHAIPDASLGYTACGNATADKVLQGRHGAGTGATVGKILGMERSMPGGIGSATIRMGEVLVSSLVIVNSLGDVVDYQDGRILAGAKNDKDEMIDSLAYLLKEDKKHDLAGQNTTIGVVATNATLTKEQANRLAQVAHDGLALSIRPVHTMMDGDTLFAASTCRLECDFNRICAAAVISVARAVANAVIASGREKYAENLNT